jgi:hypothetical protein
MSKVRKTRKEKIRTEQRKDDVSTFRVKNEWLVSNVKKTADTTILGTEDRKYFRLDLTKTFFLTMLVLALELALWQYLSRH